MGFLKGLGAGLIVGACLGMTLAPDKRRGKKIVERAIKTFGEAIDDLSDAIGV